jgi:hypothetical protein
VKRLALLLAFAGCSSPVAPSTGGEPARTRPLDDNPFRDPADSPGRDERVGRFFEARGIAFTVAAESPWVAFGSEAALVVTVRNGGTKPLTLVGERTSGIWPFSSTEHARATLRVAATLSTPAAGVRREEVDLPIDQFRTLEVAPGSERSLRLPIALAFPADVECAVALVRPVLHPLAVVVGDEPERVIALRLPEMRVGFAPKEVAQATADEQAPLELALQERTDLVVAAAVRRGERDRVPTIEELLASLPGPSVLGRRARFTALEWLTGERFGDSVERWRGWWDSKERAR